MKFYWARHEAGAARVVGLDYRGGEDRISLNLAEMDLSRFAVRHITAIIFLNVAIHVFTRVRISSLVGAKREHVVGTRATAVFHQSRELERNFPVTSEIDIGDGH